MAISRGSGTEIIRSAYFEDIDDTATKLIVGVQHHIYTVLSLVIKCGSLNAVTDAFDIKLTGYDAKEGTSAQDMHLMRKVIPAGETFVWNDKFSFNGFEPVNFTGPMDDATKQDAIADQGSGVAQYMWVSSTHAADNYEMCITYIDQNNS